MTTISSASRILGLASGLDVDAMVSSMMAAHRIPMDKLEQEKQYLQWQQEDYRTLNTALYEFRDQVFDMRLEGTFNKYSATSSQESVASVKVGGSSIEGNHVVTVNQLASGVSKASSSALAPEKDGDGKMLTLFDQFTEFADRGFTASDNITVTINGTSLEFDLDQDNIYTLSEKLNNSYLGIKANYDSTSHRFFLSTTATGTHSEISISEDSSGLFSNGVHESILKLNINDGVTYRGQNASINIGDALGIESSSNSLMVNGLSLELKQEGTTSIIVSPDTEAVVDSVKELVEAYNKVLSTLYNKLMEKPNRAYAPLTKAQKDEMSDEEIEKWEGQARRGLLRNDSVLQNIISSMRGLASGMVKGLNGDYASFSSIGIKTGLYSTNGKLLLNEDKLREALAQDSQGVQRLFTQSGPSEQEKGIAVRLYELTITGINYISDKAGSTSSPNSADNTSIGDRLKEVDNNINKWEKRLQDIEKRYYSEFTMLEIMINKMNSQAAWLAQLTES